MEVSSRLFQNRDKQLSNEEEEKRNKRKSRNKRSHSILRSVCSVFSVCSVILPLDCLNLSELIQTREIKRKEEERATNKHERSRI